jgi:hypothetical protein
MPWPLLSVPPMCLQYCNANRPYQPDLVLDVKLFGKR